MNKTWPKIHLYYDLFAMVNCPYPQYAFWARRDLFQCISPSCSKSWYISSLHAHFYMFESSALTQRNFTTTYGAHAFFQTRLISRIVYCMNNFSCFLPGATLDGRRKKKFSTFAITCLTIRHREVENKFQPNEIKMKSLPWKTGKWWQKA